MSELPRRNFPARRQGERLDFLFMLGTDEKVGCLQVNRFEDDRIGEVFCRPFKTGTDIEDLLDHFCICISFALQHGADIRAMARAMGDERAPEPVGNKIVYGNAFQGVIHSALILDGMPFPQIPAGDSPELPAGTA